VKISRIACIFFAVVTGCKDARATLESAGLIDSPPQVPVTLDVLCDPGGGSSACTQANLELAFASHAPHLPPKSLVRLYGMTDSIAETKELVRFTTTPPPKTSRRAIQRHQEQQTRDLRTLVQEAARPLFTHQKRRSSPIAENLARVLTAESPQGNRRIVVILSDARQVSTSDSLGHLDFECGRLPTTEALTAGLRRLLPDQRDVSIQFCFATLEPVDRNRCTASIERYASIKELWTTALTNLGAHVTWTTSAPTTEG
jgi:hypothetical protein